MSFNNNIIFNQNLMVILLCNKLNYFIQDLVEYIKEEKYNFLNVKNLKN